MDMSTLTYQFRLTQRVFELNLADIDDDIALRRPACGANSLNWVIGHVAQARTAVLQLLGRPAMDGAAVLDVYQAKRANDMSDDDAIPLSRLKELMTDLHASLLKGLDEAAAEHLATPAPFSPTDDPDESIGSLVAALAFHEAYHCGQCGILRRELGLDGVIPGPG